jgi:3-keto-disaccharide hydrolase
LAPVISIAEETHLFNGKSLDGWTFHLQGDEPDKVQNPWIVQRGLLICRGMTTGYLIHNDEFEDYVLTLELRTMSTEEGNGTAIGSLGSVFINAAHEEGVFRDPKSIEISLREPGDVFFRDVDRETMRDTNAWVFRAPDFADDVERDMGEWNRVKFISNGKRLTVLINGRVVNQIEPINRTKGAVAIKSVRGFVAAPTFYRNIVIKPIDEADLALEKTAAAQLARVKETIAKRKAAEEAAQAEAERMQAEAQKKLAKGWSDVQVSQDVDFKADVRRLPYPSDAREIEFRATFGMVEFESSSSLLGIHQRRGRDQRERVCARNWIAGRADFREGLTPAPQRGQFFCNTRRQCRGSNGVEGWDERWRRHAQESCAIRRLDRRAQHAVEGPRQYASGLSTKSPGCRLGLAPGTLAARRLADVGSPPFVVSDFRLNASALQRGRPSKPSFAGESQEARNDEFRDWSHHPMEACVRNRRKVRRRNPNEKIRPDSDRFSPEHVPSGRRGLSPTGRSRWRRRRRPSRRRGWLFRQPLPIDEPTECPFC